MTAKEYLEQLPTLSDRIFRKRQRLETLRGMAERVTPIYGGEAVQRTREIYPTAKIIDMVIDLEKEIAEDEQELAALKSELWDLLEKLPDERFKTILWLKYAERKPWRDIACEIGFDREYVRKELYHKAVDSLNYILENSPVQPHLTPLDTAQGL